MNTARMSMAQLISASARYFIALGAAAVMVVNATAATFGTVVPIGGHASDIALDEQRQVLYIADFTADRIEVLSLDTNTVRKSINVSRSPGALAISPDNRFLVIVHYGNTEAGTAARNALTVIDLETDARQVFGLSSPPLGVAFGADGLALVVTTTDFSLLDPVTGQLTRLDTISGATAKTLPVELATFPPQIVAASVAASRDGLYLYGLGGAGDANGITRNFQFKYEVTGGRLTVIGYTAKPEMGPRTVSVSDDGKYFTAGWALFDADGTVLAQFPNASGDYNIGSHAVVSRAG